MTIERPGRLVRNWAAVKGVIVPGSATITTSLGVCCQRALITRWGVIGISLHAERSATSAQKVEALCASACVEYWRSGALILRPCTIAKSAARDSLISPHAAIVVG